MQSEQELDTVLQEIMLRWDVPGLAAGIVTGDEIAFARAYGVQNLETQAPVTLDSVFCVQSISKCFVATAVMQWVERGQLDLDAPLVQYLPYFQLDDDRCRQITLRQMLSHTSGLPDIDESEYIAWIAHPEFDDGSAERFVRSLSRKKLVANPGERFSYSNIAYNVLGDLLAKVSGKSFEATLQEQILLPSGMPHSTFLLADVPPSLRAWPHLRSPEMKPNPIYPYQRADAPSSFLHTTLVDMCHWCLTCLNRGSYLGQRLLSPQMFDRMWQPVAKRGHPPSLFEEMGLGWSLGHYKKDEKTVCHGGGGFGWNALLLILPEKNSAAVILSNEESSAHLRAVYALADVLIGLEPQANTVSSLVPVSRAMAAGGIAAAYASYAEIESRKDEFYFREGDLLELALQLLTARKIDLALEVLDLNIHIYPQYIESYLEKAKLYRQKGETAQARASLLKALSIEPDNTDAARLLELIQ